MQPKNPSAAAADDARASEVDDREDDAAQEDADQTDTDEDVADAQDEDSSEDAEEGSEDEAEADASDEEDEKPKSGRRDRKIDKLTRQYRQSEERATRLQDEVTALQRDLERQNDAVRDARARGLKQGDPEYDRAVKAAVRAQERAEDRESARIEFVATEVATRLEDAGAADTLKAIRRAPSFSPLAVEELFSSRHTARIAKMLVNDADLFDQFVEASPVKQQAIIARLDGKLEGIAAATKKAKAGKGKPPPKTPHVKPAARATPKTPFESNDYSQADYEAYRKKQGWA